jgi:hypothetical protein
MGVSENLKVECFYPAKMLFLAVRNSIRTLVLAGRIKKYLQDMKLVLIFYPVAGLFRVSAVAG